MTRDHLGTHFLDTGPLLCLGDSKFFRDLYDGRSLSCEGLRKDAQVVEAVAHEVKRHAQRANTGNRSVYLAAREAERHYYSLLNCPVARPNPVPPELQSIENDLCAYAQSRPQQGKKCTTLHPKANRGEAESTHAAKASGAGFVSCDTGAQKVATAHGVYVESFAVLARRFSDPKYGVTEREIASGLQKISKKGIDTGYPVYSVLDLRDAQ